MLRSNAQSTDSTRGNGFSLLKRHLGVAATPAIVAEAEFLRIQIRAQIASNEAIIASKMDQIVSKIGRAHV